MRRFVSLLGKHRYEQFAIRRNVASASQLKPGIKIDLFRRLWTKRYLFLIELSSEISRYE